MIYKHKRIVTDIAEAIDEMNGFTSSMEMFMIKHPNYNYSLKLDKNTTTKGWVITAKIKKDEPKDINRTQKITEVCYLL
jgi:hypothetical protein